MVTRNKFRTTVGILFHAICLAAFTWQAVVITINFFEFQTVSSIKCIMPGKEMRKPINLCFPQRQFLNYSEYVRLFYTHPSVKYGDIEYKIDFKYANVDKWSEKQIVVMQMFSIPERFSIIIPAEEIITQFFMVNATQIKIYQTYILSDYVCYQLYQGSGNELEEWSGNIAESKPKSYAQQLHCSKRLCIEYKGIPIWNKLYKHT